jgi:chaperonin GroES
MQLKPIEHILVKIQVGEEKTASGILIPQTAQEKTQEGVVIAIGDDESIKIKKGDHIMYDKYAGKAIKIDGEEHLILKMEDILAIIE